MERKMGILAFCLSILGIVLLFLISGLDGLWIGGGSALAVDDGEFEVITGKVKEVRRYGNVTILLFEKTTEVEMVAFQEVDITEGDEVEVIGIEEDGRAVIHRIRRL